jgi:hypothetical protein
MTPSLTMCIIPTILASIKKEKKQKKTKNDASAVWKRQTILEFSIHKFLSKRKRKNLHDFYEWKVICAMLFLIACI